MLQWLAAALCWLEMCTVQNRPVSKVAGHKLCKCSQLCSKIPECTTSTGLHLLTSIMVLASCVSSEEEIQPAKGHSALDTWLHLSQ